MKVGRQITAQVEKRVYIGFANVVFRTPAILSFVTDLRDVLPFSLLFCAYTSVDIPVLLFMDVVVNYSFTDLQCI